MLGTSYHEYAGGKGLNQAVAAARSGASVTFVGALGDDAAGRQLLEVLRLDGIDTGQTEIVSAPTGRAAIVVDETGENSIVVVPGANALVAPTEIPVASVVLCQLEIPHEVVGRVLRAAEAAMATTVLNPAPAVPLPAEVLARCDVIVPNEHEAELLGGPRSLLDAGCGAVVVTCGGDGVDVHTRDEVRHRDALPVTVVDTTGAGDAFCGSLAARIAAGDDLWEATAWAAAAGALATTVRGAVPAQPTTEQIQALLIDGGQ